MNIHPTAIIGAGVKLGRNIYVGPYSIVGGDETSFPTLLGDEVHLEAHVVIGAATELHDRVWCGAGCHIGDSCVVQQDAQIMYRAQIHDRVKIGISAWVGGFLCNDSVVEREAVVLGQLIHRFTDAIEEVPEPAPWIGPRGFVGTGALVIGGVRVGEEAYIAAGAVLTKHARERRLYRGNPAIDSGPAPVPFEGWRQ